MNIKSLFSCVLCLLTFSVTTWSQSTLTEHTFRLDDEAKSPSASLEDMGWLHGFWKGEGLGGQVDASWSGSVAGTMVGTFRLVKNDQIEFSEFLEISQKDGSLVLKVKHFDRELNGWEEKDKFAEFALVRLDDKTANFDGLTYTIDEEGDLRAYVAMKQKDGTIKEGDFVFQREASGDLDKPKEDAYETIAIELPDDPEAVVLTYDIEVKSRRATEEDFQPTTLFRLLANGKVLVGRNDPRATELEYTITKEEVQELLEEIVNKRQIFEITTDGIKQKFQDTGRPFFLLDAPIYRISINLGDKQHEVQVEGLISTRRFYKEVAQLQTFAKMHDKFTVMRARAALGTQNEIDELMDAVVKKFKKQYPDVEPLSLEDVESAIIDENGRLLAEFKRVDFENDRAIFAYSCTVVKYKGKTTITIMRARLG